MNDQNVKANQFHKLHQNTSPLVLNNIWDAGSTKAVDDSGANAIATSSWAIAASHGYPDGENLSVDVLYTILKEIISTTDLPVTCDIEAGYGHMPEDIAKTVKTILEIGVIGCNIEDQIPNENTPFSISEQSKRLKAAVDCAENAGIDLFVNARIDEFFLTDDDRDNHEKLKATMARISAYHDVGCHGVFIPNLLDLDLIGEICAKSPLPVNIMRPPNGPSIDALAQCGVKRVSSGPFSYIQAMEFLKSL